MRHTALLLALVAVAASPASALTPYLVRDIDLVPLPLSSSPLEMTAIGSLAVFSAGTPETGSEPWVSDGTVAGTFLLVDACPGLCSGSPRDFIATGEGSVFFLAANALWVTRGTPVSTFQLTEAPVSVNSLLSSVWAAGRRRLYFAADDGIHGAELWTSDGTAAGTFQVADVRPGAAGSAPGYLAVLQNKVFFSAESANGSALWMSDGTSRGTRVVKSGASAPQNPISLQPLGNVLVFRAFSPARGQELWMSDGTSRGTVLLLDIEPGPASSLIGPFTVLGGRLLFPGGDRRRGVELWATDGTPGGTRPLTSLPDRGGLVGEGTPRFPLGRRAVFLADDGVRGAEPWITDGTPAGTRLLADVCRGACSSVDTSVSMRGAVLGNRLFLPLADARGRELWSTDGTTAGTRIAKDICPGACASRPRAFAAGRGRVLFAADDGRLGPEVWASNGTPQGTVRLTSFATAQPFGDFVSAVALPAAVLFTADDGEHGEELWKSDTTAAGTGLVADLAIGDRGGSFPTCFLPAGDRLWFVADDGDLRELWSSDGTFEGTRSAFDLLPIRPHCSPYPGSAVALGGRTFLLLETDSLSPGFWATDGTPAGTVSLNESGPQISSDLFPVGSHVLFFVDDEQGTSIWRSDGTLAGTVQVEDLTSDSTVAFPRDETIFNGKLFFAAGGNSPAGEELWTSDGTAEGTFVAADVIPGDISSGPTGLAVFGNRLYFFADTVPGGLQKLWSTDGTAAGTHVALDLESDRSPVPAGDRMFLFAAAPDEPMGLWATDGTPGGTRFLQEVLPSPRFGEIPPVALGGRLFFAGPGATSEVSRLWTSDGTPEGTRPVVDHEGEEVLNPVLLRVFAGRLVFLAALDGNETLWESDGTAAGTAPILSLARIPEAPPGWSGTDLAVAGDRLFFPAYDPASGTELWALTPE